MLAIAIAVSCISVYAHPGISLSAVQNATLAARGALLRGENGKAAEVSSDALSRLGMCTTIDDKSAHALILPGLNMGTEQRTRLDCSAAGKLAANYVPAQVRPSVSSLLTTLGVALHRAHQSHAAAPILIGAAVLSDCDEGQWANAGDIHVMVLDLETALLCFSKALQCNEVVNALDLSTNSTSTSTSVNPSRARLLGKLHKAGAWQCRWGGPSGLDAARGPRHVEQFLAGIGADAAVQTKAVAAAVGTPRPGRSDVSSVVVQLVPPIHRTNGTGATSSEAQAVATILQQAGGCVGVSSLGPCSGWGAPDRHSSILAVRMALRACAMARSIDPVGYRIAAQAGAANAAIVPAPAGTIPSSADVHGIAVQAASIAAQSEPLARDETVVLRAAERRCATRNGKQRQRQHAMHLQPPMTPPGALTRADVFPTFGLPVRPLRSISSSSSPAPRPSDSSARSNSSAGISTSHPLVVRRPLRVGFLSSDFGVHPVAQLVRGVARDLGRASRPHALPEDSESWRDIGFVPRGNT